MPPNLPPLRLNTTGIVLRREEDVVVYHHGLHGGPGTEVEIDKALADDYGLSTGDVLGETELSEDGRITGFTSINGLPLDGAYDRPLPRPNRNALERVKPHRHVPLTTSPSDITGRALDIAASLGVGCAGLIYGPHGSGVTTALRSVVSGVVHNTPDLVPILLLIGARSEEVTDWRRRFPTVEVVVCPNQEAGATAAETLLAAELVRECAQRQTELNRHVFLAVDSLTALWAAMLEIEEADAQREADTAAARRSVREWFERGGDFGGEGLLGSGLGGSLTLVGTAWHQPIDPDAEEEGESHPHLRLLEHVLNEATWRVALDGELAGQRLYPAIDLHRCLSPYEQTLLPAEEYARLTAARLALHRLAPASAYEALAEAIQATEHNEEALELLTPDEDETTSEPDPNDFWSAWPTAE